MKFREPFTEFLGVPGGPEMFTSLLHRWMTLERQYPAEEAWVRINEEIGATGCYAPMMISQLRFFMLGQSIFVVGPMMQQLFALTSLENMPLEEVKFPSSAFYVAVPDSGISVWNEESGLHELAGCYVLKGVSVTGEPGLYFVAWGPPHVGCPAWDDACFNFFLPLNGTLGDELDWVRGRIVTEQVAPPEFGLPMCDFVIKVVIGLCLYLSTPDAELRKEARNPIPRSERRRQEKRKAPTDPVKRPYTVTYIAPSVERTATPALLAELRSPVRQHWVMGHWHRYWVGSGENKELSPRWLKPYRRGVSAADAVHHHVAALKGQV